MLIYYRACIPGVLAAIGFAFVNTKNVQKFSWSGPPRPKALEHSSDVPGLPTPPLPEILILGDEILGFGINAVMFYLGRLVNKEKVQKVNFALQGSLGVGAIGLNSWVLGDGNPSVSSSLFFFLRATCGSWDWC